jgi:hypothetical protein
VVVAQVAVLAEAEEQAVCVVPLQLRVAVDHYLLLYLYCLQQITQ